MLDTFKRVDVAGERKRLHCVNCKCITIHNLEAQCIGEWRDDYAHINGGRKHSIFRCGACDAVCYETISWDTEDLGYDEDGDPYPLESTTQYPAPTSAHFNFNTESTPPQLDIILGEMLYALAGSKMITATISLRLAIEYIVNDKKCSGKNLAQKIDDLKSKGLIDEDQKDLLHIIRKRGNSGAHAAMGMPAAELLAGMSIVEGLLEKLYNGPARHEATIKRAKLLIKDK